MVYTEMVIKYFTHVYENDYLFLERTLNGFNIHVICFLS